MDTRRDERLDVMFDVSDDAEGGGDHEEDERDNGEHRGHSVSTWQVQNTGKR